LLNQESKYTFINKFKAQMNKIENSQIGSTILMSAEGYSNLISTKDGKDLHWTTDIKTELPIKMAASGNGAIIKPETIP
jgi:hypothetical protein